MPRKQPVQLDEKVSLKLTAAERKLILEDLMCLDRDYEQVIRDSPPGQPVMMMLDDLDDFGGYIAAEANHCGEKRKQKRLDAIFERIQALLDRHTDEKPLQTVKIEAVRTAKLISDQAGPIAEWVAQALVGVEQFPSKQKPLEDFWLAPAQREILRMVPGLSKSIQRKLAKENSSFTVAEVASMTITLAEALSAGEAPQQVAALLVIKHLMDRLEEGIVGLTKSIAGNRKQPAKAAPASLYQFKVVLLDIKPAIWRRIQVQDCTLADLHHHIQAAFGWWNYHLHQFEIDGIRYGSPPEDQGDIGLEMEDDSSVLLSQLLPKSGKLTRWVYEYDFGDGWRHEIHYQGSPSTEKKAKYPICLEGERACPPEDVGGPGGFAEYLDALADPNHPEHNEFMEWRGPFDPVAFDAKKATKEMKKVTP